MPFARRKTARLRFGRISSSGARYFVTACVRNRQPVFSETKIATHISDVLHRIHDDDDATLLAATIMPDHVHLLFTLGHKLLLGQVLAKFKSLARFERRLRVAESIESYGLYIFMNPYRAGLIPAKAVWPWWRCFDSSLFGFLSQLNPDGTPPVEWMHEIEAISARVVTS